MPLLDVLLGVDDPAASPDGLFAHDDVKGLILGENADSVSGVR